MKIFRNEGNWFWKYLMARSYFRSFLNSFQTQARTVQCVVALNNRLSLSRLVLANVNYFLCLSAGILRFPAHASLTSKTKARLFFLNAGVVHLADGISFSLRLVAPVLDSDEVCSCWLHHLLLYTKITPSVNTGNFSVINWSLC